MMEDFKKPNQDPILKTKKNEDYILTGIDYDLKGKIFSRDNKSPNSIISYWKNIISKDGIPNKREEQIDYFLLQMEGVNLDSYRRGKISEDKDYVQKSIEIDFDNMENNPGRSREKLLERVYAHCLVELLKNKDVIYGGNDEEISLEKNIRSHPYDLNKRHVQQILSMEDTRYPNQEFNLALGVQWGHENTDDEAIENRFSFIINGISDHGSTTEVCYTPVDEKQTMPISMPFVIVGGDVQRITSFVDQVMKGEYGEASKSPLVYNALVQIKTQIDLFYNIALQQQKKYSTMQAPTDEYKKMRFMVTKDKLHETVNSYTSMKNIIDQVFEANAHSIEDAKPKKDIVHEKIMSICEELAKRNNVSL